MKNKTLLIWNAVLYAIQYSISMFYIGYEYGKTSNLLSPAKAEFLIFPAVSLVFLLIGINMVRNHEYVTPKGCYSIAFSTLLYSGLLFGIYLLAFFRGFLSEYVFPDILIYSGSVLGCAIPVFVMYIICAVRVGREFPYI